MIYLSDSSVLPPTGQGSCIACLGGYVCVSGTNDTSVPCDPGHYCPAGTQHPTQYPCPAGTYNPLPTQASSSACQMCTPGQYCQGHGLAQPAGNCSAGWFCTGGATDPRPIVLGEEIERDGRTKLDTWGVFY